MRTVQWLNGTTALWHNGTTAKVHLLFFTIEPLSLCAFAPVYVLMIIFL
jgi:hypothetical protein